MRSFAAVGKAKATGRWRLLHERFAGYLQDGDSFRPVGRRDVNCVRGECFAGELELDIRDAAGGHRYVGGHGVYIVYQGIGAAGVTIHAVLRGFAAGKCEADQVIVARRNGSPAGLCAIQRERRAKPVAPISASVVVEYRVTAIRLTIPMMNVTPMSSKSVMARRAGARRAMTLTVPTEVRLNYHTASFDSLLIHAVRCRIERKGAAVDWIYRNSVRKIIQVGADVRQVICRPGALLDVPAFDRRVDRRLVVGADLLLRGIAGNGDSRHDDGRDDPEDRNDGQQFHQ